MYTESIVAFKMYSSEYNFQKLVLACVAFHLIWCMCVVWLARDFKQRFNASSSSSWVFSIFAWNSLQEISSKDLMHHHRNHPRCEYFQSLLEISCKRLQEKNGSWSSSCIWGCHWVLHQHHMVDIWIKMRWIYHLHSQPLRPALHLTPFHILASHEFHFLDFIFLANILNLKHLGWPGLSSIWLICQRIFSLKYSFKLFQGQNLIPSQCTFSGFTSLIQQHCVYTPPWCSTSSKHFPRLIQFLEPPLIWYDSQMLHFCLVQPKPVE